MNFLIIIISTVATISFLFSFWTFRAVKKHLNSFKKGYKHFSSLTDEKYFELKARQEYIIYSSILVFSVITFLGINSINDLKQSMSKELEIERRKLDSLNKDALNKYFGLNKKGDAFSSSVDSALTDLDKLNRRMYSLSKKDILNQNIYIVDPINLSSYKLESDEYRTIKFEDLNTISGVKLPKFKAPPSIIGFSSTEAWLIVKDVTSESFKLRLDYIQSEKSGLNGSNIKVSLWISQKPNLGDFSNDFSSDFK